MALRAQLFIAGVLVASQVTGAGARSAPRSAVLHVQHGRVHRLASTLTILHAFTGVPDGQNPFGSLVAGTNGELFGTTEYGGEHGNGTVFEIMPSGTGYKQLVAFGGPDGQNPIGALLLDSSGNIYGTTLYGGKTGNGTVFKLTQSGSSYTESVIYSFRGSDGQNPAGGLTLGKGNVLYGSTLFGGSTGDGIVFKLTPGKKTYKERVLYNFTGAADMNPTGTLLLKSGILYGATIGASGTNGALFAVTIKSSTESDLFVFNGTDGSAPTGSLIVSSTGVFYGTTSLGGSAGLGTVFSLTKSGKTYTQSVLYSFLGGSDGANPMSGVAASGTTLYGVTEYGGSANDGTVYGISLAGSQPTESLLFPLQGGSAPQNPVGGVVVDSSGVIYGTSAYAGGATGNGSVFSLKP